MTDSHPLIPRKTFFGNPDRVSVSLSPDGSKIAYVAPFNGVLNVWVAPTRAPHQAKPITQDTHRGIRTYLWAYTNDHILYLQDQEGDENWQLYSVELSTGNVERQTPEGSQAYIVKVSPLTPYEILVAVNDRDPRLHDVDRLNLLTGERLRILKNPGFVHFVADAHLKIRFATRFTENGGSEVFRYDGSWVPFTTIPPEDGLTTTPIGLDRSEKSLYLIDSRERNTAALVVFDLGSNQWRVLAEESKADISDVLLHPTHQIPQAVAFTYDRKTWRVLDETLKDDFAYLESSVDGELEVLSRTLDDHLWLVAYTVDDGPVRYYLYDRRIREIRFLFTNRKELEGLPLAKMYPVTIKSRDGWDLVSYLTLPPWSDRKGKPDKPLPMVLWVHGGPWYRDTWGYHPVHQWLANRGYAVLSVNFRGSTGFGKAFINAANREWGGKMHDDLIDAVQWAIQQGIAQKDKIAVMGGSYGGYATLVGLTRTPEVFACGVDIVGPSNLITWMETIPPYWQPLTGLLIDRVGDPRTPEGRAFLRERSPLFHVDQIQRPLLIAHGANDPRVKKQESDQIVKALQEKGIPVIYLLYPDEGHGFVRPENNLSFFAIAEAFLARCLGGRVEPIGDDLQGSSVTVLAGSQEIPGVVETQGSDPAGENILGLD